MTDKKVILIVGAGPGLGLAVANRFGKEGYRTALIARRRETGDALQATLAESGIDAKAFVADVRDSSSVEAAVDAAMDHFGRVDVFEYGPYSAQFIPPSSVTVQIAQEAMGLMWFGAIAAVNKILPPMLKRGAGALLFTNGRSSLLPMKLLGSLGPGAAALRNYTYGLNLELKERGIYAGMITMCAQIKKEEATAMAELYWSMVTARDRIEVVLGSGVALPYAQDISSGTQTYCAL